MTAKVAIIGRTNVGKSTLFNRLVGRRIALVDPAPGVTRDWRAEEARLGDLVFTLIDTAGLADAGSGDLARRLAEMTRRAAAEADVLIFMVDAREGLHPWDTEIADWLRRVDRPVILVANKAEGRLAAFGAAEMHALGLGDPIPISAAHGEGLQLLYEALAPHLPAPGQAQEDEARAGEDAEPRQEGGVGEEDDALPAAAAALSEGDLAFDFAASEQAEGVEERPLRLAVIGRPNVGKSTLVNRLLGEERMLTGPEPGLTREPIAHDLDWDGRPFTLVDTAGLRRPARVDPGLERASAGATLDALRQADVALLLIDATEGVTHQDLRLAERIVEAGCAAVIGLNKWDLVSDRLARERELRARLEARLPDLRGVAILPLSGLQGRGVSRVMEAAEEAFQRWSARIPTPVLNRFLETVVGDHPPPAWHGRPTKIRFAAQVRARPPGFALFVNHPKAVGEGYQRYLANALRREFGLGGVPIRFYLRKSANPYATGRRTKRQRLEAAGKIDPRRKSHRRVRRRR